jgi:hypothetical protein
MNRSSFLSCLSFLKPLGVYNATDDNGKHHGENSQDHGLLATLSKLFDDKKCQKHVFLSDDSFQVSIEPTASMDTVSGNNDGTSLGPAYFVNPPQPSQRNSFDCAMCSFRLQVYTATYSNNTIHLTTTTPIKNFCLHHHQQQHHHDRTAFGEMMGRMGHRNNNNYSANNNNSDSRDNAAPVTKTESIVVLVMDGEAYQLDIAELKGVRIVKKRCSKDKNNNQNIPPCLILELPSCWFRIFSINDGVECDEESSSLPSSSIMDALNDAKKILDELWNNQKGDRFCPFPLRFQSRCVDAKSPLEETNVDLIFPACMNQRWESHKTAWTDLEELKHVFSHPVSSLPELVRQYNFQTFFLDKLTNIPKQTAKSIVEDKDLVVTLDFCQDYVDKNHESLHSTMDTFWKSRQYHQIQTKRRRVKASHKKNNSNDEVIQKDCIDQTNKLLKCHKAVMEAKYKLSTLPKRGL